MVKIGMACIKIDDVAQAYHRLTISMYGFTALSQLMFTGPKSRFTC